jgi:hypothetical protein
MAEPSITCPRCNMTSYHPEDIRHGYCGNCHAFTTDRGPHYLVMATIPGHGTHRRILFKELGEVEEWLRARPTTRARAFVLTELDTDVLLA